MHYPSEADLLPNNFDQGEARDPFDSLDQKYKDFQQRFDGIDLHPNATHLLFFDTLGHRCEEHVKARGRDYIPHDHIHALRRALFLEGVSEGVILMNGGMDEVEQKRASTSKCKGKENREGWEGVRGSEGEDNRDTGMYTKVYRNVVALFMYVCEMPKL